jgi:ribonuclease M5
MFKEVIVVEGNHDKSKINQIFDTADIVVTNGAEISLDTLESLKQLNQKRGLILLLDPDYPGERIRKIINDYVGPTKHVFIDKKYCVDTVKHKVGIEHAPLKIIEEALFKHVHNAKDSQSNITMKDLTKLGLMGQANSKEKRNVIAKQFHFAPSNAKTFLKYLNMFGLTKEEIERCLYETIES